MQVIRDGGDPGAAVGPSAVTIGAYDGVHRGHVAVLRLVRELAHARGLAATVVTFDRHPAEIARPESAPALLTTLDQRLELLEATGLVDTCCVLTFDDSRRTETAEAFVHEVLVERLATRLVVVGADFHFGFRRAGNVALLEHMGADLNFEVVGLGLVAPVGESLPFSSTRIRERIRAGDVAEAARLLDRNYSLRGTVEHGDKRGRKLGFPTANVAVPARMCLPADGIYAGTLRDGSGVVRTAAISLGRRPTFYVEAELSLLEAFVLDFDGDLYDQSVEVEFVQRLRGQERFDSVEALVTQITRDVEVSRRVIDG